MDGRVHRRAISFLLFVFVISDNVNSQRQNPPGDVPIVNPTPPGTTPIVNPPTTPLPTPPTTPAPTPPTTPSQTPPTTPSPTPPTTITGPGTTPTTPSPPSPTTTGPNPTNPPTTSGGGSWCIANPSASETALQVALDYACGYGGADCSAIQPNGACSDPDTVRDHASYAFNSYYQKNPSPTSCDFGGTAQITNTDPSHGNCRFASANSTPRTPPMTTPPTMPMTPPSTTTPVSPYPPVGGNGFGSEPTGSDYGLPPASMPNWAGAISVNKLLLITVNCLLLSAAIANHF